MAKKTEGGSEYSSSAYLYVPDPDKPSTWKLRIEEGPGNVTVAQLGRAAAALGPGFRGQKVQMPAADRKKAAKKLIGKYRGQGVSDDDIPAYLWGIAGMSKPKELEGLEVEVPHIVDKATTETTMKATNLVQVVADTRDAFYQKYPQAPLAAPDLYVCEVWDTFLIVEEYSAGVSTYYQVPYGKTADGYTFPDRSAWTEVEQTWTPAPEAKCLDIQVRDMDSSTQGEAQPPDTDSLTVDTKERRSGLEEKQAESLMARIGRVVKDWLREDQQNPQYESGNMLVTFKQDDGLYRWVSVSSTAVQDKEREIVSRRALESAVKMADVTGQRGSLDWWHVDGLDLGWCDFQATHDYALIESGLWSPSLEGRKAAQYHMDNPGSLAVSIKFLYDPEQTEVVKASDGLPVRVYKDGVMILNRAVLPTGKEAAWFTTVDSMEVVSVDKQKRETLVEMLGEDLANGMIARAEEVPKAAKAMNLMLKDLTEATEEGETGQEDQTHGQTMAESGTEEPDGTAQTATEDAIPDLAKALAELPEDKRKAILEALGAKQERQEKPDHEDVSMDAVVKAMAALTNQVTKLTSEVGDLKEKGQNAPRSTAYRASQDTGNVDQDAGTGPGQPFEERLSRSVAERMISKLGAG